MTDVDKTLQTLQQRFHILLFDIQHHPEIKKIETINVPSFVVILKLMEKDIKKILKTYE